jgi:glycosyltransferase involved in cell wall biosynthesis
MIEFGSPMKNNPPVVSTVIPAHNSSAFLGDAVESVLAQTFLDHEILVVDDGSTDETPEVAATFGDKIRYFRQEHSGPAAARNNGIAESKGRFVAFLDSDDIWLPEKLEKQLAMFESDPGIGLVTTNHQGFTAEGECPPWKSKGPRLFGERNVATAIFLHSNIGTPTVMVPKRVLDEVGGFEEGLQIGEDDNLWIRIAASYRVALVEDVLVRIRLRSDSITRDGDRFFEDVGKNITWLCERYPTVRPLIQDAIPTKLSDYNTEFGCYLFRNERFPEAREALQSAIRYQPRNWRAWKCLLLTLFPEAAVRYLRSLKAPSGSA